MNKISLMGIVVVVAIAAVGGYYFLSDGWQGSVNESQSPMPTSEVTNEESTVSPSPIVSSTSTPLVEVEVGATVKAFTVITTPFKFSVTEIMVKKGETVKITLRNDGGMHDWVVDEFNARTKVLQTGETDTIEFVADKTGTFEYYCSVMQHRQMGMVGKLIVTE